MSSKKQSAERDKAIASLRETLKPGDTVYTVLRHVSRSGMQREISLHFPVCREDGKGTDMLWLSGLAAKAMGDRVGKRDGIIIGGCGMDMGFALVHSLSETLYGKGYQCLGKDGGCPSNYHVNHRAQVRCPANCWRPSWSEFKADGHKDWPGVPGGAPAYCQGGEESGDTPVRCPTCKGLGSVPNPEGPERFDLVHTDGYALKHRWI